MNALLLSVGAIVLAKILDRSSPRAGDSTAQEHTGAASLSGLFRSSGGENIPSGGGSSFSGKIDPFMPHATASPERSQTLKGTDVGALSPVRIRIGSDTLSTGGHLDPRPVTEWRMVS